MLEYTTDDVEISYDEENSDEEKFNEKNWIQKYSYKSYILLFKQRIAEYKKHYVMLISGSKVKFWLI